MMDDIVFSRWEYGDKTYHLTTPPAKQEQRSHEDIDLSQTRVQVILKDGSALWVTADKIDKLREDGLIN